MNRRSNLRSGRLRLPGFKKVKGTRVQYAWRMKIPKQMMDDIPFLTTLIRHEVKAIKKRHKIYTDPTFSFEENTTDFRMNVVTGLFKFYVIRSYKPRKKK